MHDSGISVIIPVYNGSQTLPKLLERLERVLSKFKDYEIIMVDDSSSDDSYSVIKSMAEDNQRIVGILLDGNYGQQNAILCGLRHSTMEYAVIMDDDLENQPEDIPELYKELQKGFDVVYGLSKEKIKASVFRRFGSIIRDAVFNWLTNKPRDIKVCSFRIMKKSIIDKVVKAEGSFVYISMEILKFTTNIGNIRVIYGPRKDSGHSTWKLVKLITRICMKYSNVRLTKRSGKARHPYKIAEINGKGV